MKRTKRWMGFRCKNIGKYPATFTLIGFTLVTRIYSATHNNRRIAAEEMKLSKLERYEDVLGMKQLFRLFCQFNSSPNNLALGVNMATLFIIGRNLEILFGSKFIFLILASNMTIHYLLPPPFIDQYISLIFGQKSKEYDFSTALTLLSFSTYEYIAFPRIFKWGGFVAFIYLLWVYQNEDFWSPIISGFIMSLYAKWRFRTIL